MTTSDRRYRDRLPPLPADDPTIPPVGAFGVVFHAKRSHRRRVRRALLRFVPARSPRHAAQLVRGHREGRLRSSRRRSWTRRPSPSAGVSPQQDGGAGRTVLAGADRTWRPPRGPRAARPGRAALSGAGDWRSTPAACSRARRSARRPSVAISRRLRTGTSLSLSCSPTPRGSTARLGRALRRPGCRRAFDDFLRSLPDRTRPESCCFRSRTRLATASRTTCGSRRRQP